MGNRENGGGQLATWSSSRCGFWMSRGCQPELGKAVGTGCWDDFPWFVVVSLYFQLLTVMPAEC